MRPNFAIILFNLKTLNNLLIKINVICWLFVGHYEPTSKSNKKASLGNSLV